MKAILITCCGCSRMVDTDGSRTYRVALVPTPRVAWANEPSGLSRETVGEVREFRRQPKDCYPFGTEPYAVYREVSK